MEGKMISSSELFKKKAVLGSNIPCLPSTTTRLSLWNLRSRSIVWGVFIRCDGWGIYCIVLPHHIVEHFIIFTEMPNLPFRDLFRCVCCAQWTVYRGKSYG